MSNFKIKFAPAGEIADMEEKKLPLMEVIEGARWAARSVLLEFPDLQHALIYRKDRKEEGLTATETLVQVEKVERPDVAMIQTCPSRLGNPGPWQRKGIGLDLWHDNRWSKDFIATKKKREEWLAKAGPGSSCSETSDEWHFEGDIPRTCSFCGSIHPDDAIRLMKAGWECEGTGKSYKRYLQPPGYAKHMAEVSKIHHDSLVKNERPIFPKFWSPTPPCKLYVDHMSPEQIKQFNAVLDERKSGRSGSGEM